MDRSVWSTLEALNLAKLPPSSPSERRLDMLTPRRPSGNSYGDSYFCFAKLQTWRSRLPSRCSSAPLERDEPAEGDVDSKSDYPYWGRGGFGRSPVTHVRQRLRIPPLHSVGSR